VEVEEKNLRPSLSKKQQKAKWTEGVAEVIEYFHSKHKALSSSPCNAKKVIAFT
jgi:hypothetical protein